MLRMCIQARYEDLVGIMIAANDREVIIFTHDPEEILENLQRNPGPAIIVSGSTFNSLVIPHGYDLARKVKAINPDAIFLYYSVFPDIAAEIDGYLPKGQGEPNGPGRLPAHILTLADHQLTLDWLTLNTPSVRWLERA